MRAAASMTRPGPESRASAETRGEGESLNAHQKMTQSQDWVIFI